MSFFLTFKHINKQFEKNQKGQALLESILMMLIFLGLFHSLSSLLQKDFLQKVVTEPWARLDYMVQNGEWQEDKGHPNLFDNHLTEIGEKP